MNLWTNLLFAHGHIANVDLAKSLANPSNDSDTLPATASSSPSRQIEAQRRKPAPRRHRPAHVSLLDSLSLLGGRPMTAGHNDDIEEPFDLGGRQPALAGCGPGHLRAC